jgi:Arc/MetJ-type ribon-helix-helix transcriptional regulator
MVTERLEVRLDREHRAKLERLAEKRQASVSEVVRSLIDRFYEEDVLREQRIRAARQLGEMKVGEPLEPEELSKLLNEAHSPGDLY